LDENLMAVILVFYILLLVCLDSVGLSLTLWDGNLNDWSLRNYIDNLDEPKK
jgi:hypothetical protein